MEMNMRALIALFAAMLLVVTPVLTIAEELDDEDDLELDDELDDLDEDGDEEEEETGRFRIVGDINIGIKVVEQNSDSSKFNEYKDDDTAVYLNRFLFDLEDTETGRVFDLRVKNLVRDDQDIFMEYGDPGHYAIDFHLSDTPYRISDNAKTPYQYAGSGFYRVADDIVNAIQISDVASADSWAAPDAGAGGAGEDARISSVLSENVHDIGIGTERRDISLGLKYNFSKRTKARLEFAVDTKKGRLITGASIGDRPSRSMTVQLPEPIDYRNEGIKFYVEHRAEQYQLDATYEYSKFENKVDTLSWNSLFHAAGYFGPDGDSSTTDGGSDYDDIRIGATTRYATTGRIALSPDNTYENIMLNVGINLPMMSRLNATVSMGKMEQDEDLLPYATSSFGGTLDSLPRAEADAKIDTKMVNLFYTIRPIKKLNTRIYYRYYDLDNKTPESEFYYYTQDSNSEYTSDITTRNYRNERVSLAYAYQHYAYGLDLSYYLGKKGAVGLVAEKSIKKRDYRATDETDEDMLTLSYRVRPMEKVSVKVKYKWAEREAGNYDGEVTDLSYHYDTTVYANESSSPVSGFGNNPGLRQYDIADRDRDQFDLTVGVVPIEEVTINFAYHLLKNDYSSKIASQITSWDSIRGVFDTVSIDPTQLGLLEDESTRFVLDLNYRINDEMLAYGFLSQEMIDTDQRGRYMNENHKINNIRAARDWRDESGKYVWNADLSDETNTIGIGFDYFVEESFDIQTYFTHSEGVVDVDYKPGSEIAEDDTSSLLDHAEWYSPGDVKFKTNTFNIIFTKHLAENMKISCSYLYEEYDEQDWQQAGSSAHQQVFGGQYVANADPETAGTGNDRVGSRLVTLSNNLAPDYDVHMISINFGYKW